ncbi:uncharacterized protein LOC117227978 [Megalopta genalis]|uniref:uncharacterized protein LOC117227978 n=1 Tax=Megalopta genalis TaxID=115081 RepID=UPI003FD5F342
MDENKYVEVTIANSNAEIPVSDAEHVHSTLSIIREYGNSSGPHLSFGKAFSKYVRNSKSTKYGEFDHASGKKDHSTDAFDIDLLLKYYACSSSMENSINKMFGITGDKGTPCLHDPLDSQVCKDTDRRPLIELGAVHKVFNLLPSESFENVTSLASHLRDAVIKLQSLLSRCNINEFKQILSSDPSIKICEHCGVISCSKPRNTSMESRQSPPRTSYFLNTQIFSNKDTENTKLQRTAEKFHTKKQQSAKRFGKYCDTRKSSPVFTRYSDKKQNCRLTDKKSADDVKPDDERSENAPQRVEIMIAERENGVETGKTRIVQSVVSEPKHNKMRVRDGAASKKKHLRSCNNVFQASESLFAKGQKPAASQSSDKTNHVEKTLDQDCTKIPAVDRDSQRTKSFKSADCDATASLVDSKTKEGRVSLTRSERSSNEMNEKVVKDISYEKSKIDGSRPEVSPPKSTEDVMSHCNVDSIIDTMTYLAHGRFDSTDIKQDEFVVQYNDRAWMQSRNSNNRHRFILHAGRDCDPQLASVFNMNDESKHPDRTGSKNKFGNAKNISRSNERSVSLACVIEDDSLEDCTKVLAPQLDSDRSASSSSAENMIREWMNCPQEGKSSADVNNHEITISSSPLIIGLDVKLQTPGTNDKCLCCRETSIDKQQDLQTKHSNGKKEKDLSSVSNDQEEAHLSMEQVVRTCDQNLKLQGSQESVNSDAKKKRCKQVDSTASKKFSIKQFLESFKSIKTAKSTKRKDSKLNWKPSSLSSKNLSHSSMKNVPRRISYNESSFKSLIDDDRGHGEVANTLSLYRKILENTKGMDWDSFKRFIGRLHASQKELWRDICNAIDNEAKRLADKGDGVTEVCIEISSVPGKGTKHAERSCSNEIVFEMDMTLRDVEGFLDSELALPEKSQLDTLWRASEVIRVRNDDVCNTEVASNQAE